MLILLNGYTTWTLTKRLEKKLDGNYTRILRTILNKSWRQHPKKQQLYGHLPPITKTIQVRQTRHVRHYWRSRDELISDVLLWTPLHGWAKAGWPARTYTQQLCANTGCSLEDPTEAMDDREGWQKRVRENRADSMTWWWWPLQNYFSLVQNHFLYPNRIISCITKELCLLCYRIISCIPTELQYIMSMDVNWAICWVKWNLISLSQSLYHQFKERLEKILKFLMSRRLALCIVW